MAKSAGGRPAWLRRGREGITRRPGRHPLKIKPGGGGETASEDVFGAFEQPGGGGGRPAGMGGVDVLAEECILGAKHGFADRVLQRSYFWG